VGPPAAPGTAPHRPHREWPGSRCRIGGSWPASSSFIENFPGQFKHLALPWLVAADEVTATTLQGSTPSSWNGVRIVSDGIERGSTRGIHPWVSDFETKVIRGEAFFRKALQLRSQG
jgi:hypothetical protein